ncbi:MAG: hypothetical protein SGARI_001527 [Bacillariaceae sp.]
MVLPTQSSRSLFSRLSTNRNAPKYSRITNCVLVSLLITLVYFAGSQVLGRRSAFELIWNDKACTPSTDNNHVWSDKDDLMAACVGWKKEHRLSIQEALGHLGDDVVQKANEFVARTKETSKMDLGAGPVDSTKKPDFVPTEMPVVNILNATQLASMFDLQSFSAIKAEHVWEHFEYSDALKGLQNLRCLLKSSGFARIAVPDAGHPDQEYQTVKVKEGFPDRFFTAGYRNSSYPGHRSLWTESKFSQIANIAGLNARPLEWWSPSSVFCTQPHDEKAAWIGRTQKHDVAAIKALQ